MQRGKEGLANGSRVFCFFFHFLFFLVPLLHFYFIKNPPLSCSYSSSSTCHLRRHSQTSLDSYPPPLLFLIFVRKHKRARIFDTTYFYMSYSCKNEMTQNIRLIILEGLLMFCLCTSAEDRIQKALKE